METKPSHISPGGWFRCPMRCGSSDQSTCGSAPAVISSVIAIIPTAAKMAKPPVCLGPIRLKAPMTRTATIAHSPGESHANRASACDSGVWRCTSSASPASFTATGSCGHDAASFAGSTRSCFCKGRPK
jgi:hypothetical protein